jgi:hypothetical protein
MNRNGAADDRRDIEPLKNFRRSMAKIRVDTTGAVSTLRFTDHLPDDYLKLIGYLQEEVLRRMLSTPPKPHVEKPAPAKKQPQRKPK